MKRRFAAALLFLVASCTSTPTTEPDPGVEAFRYACSALDVTGACKYISPPTVIVTRLLGPKMYGVYVFGEQYIFINPDSDDVQRTIVHETTHYVLFKTGLNRAGHPMFNRMLWCQHEEIARRVAAQWAGVEYSDDWRAWYQCTTTPPSHIKVRNV